MRRALVIGSSSAGLRAAEGLAHGSYPGSVTLIGAEGHAPYDRTALSKGCSLGSRPPTTSG